MPLPPLHRPIDPHIERIEFDGWRAPEGWLALTLGLVTVALGASYLRREPMTLILVLVVGVLFTALAILMLLARTVLDAEGIHVGRKNPRHYPWPRSRTGLYVVLPRRARAPVSARIHLVTGHGESVALPGLEHDSLTWRLRYPGRDSALQQLENYAVTDCHRIWNWAVLRGYTHETGEHTKLREPSLQARRQEQEERFGIGRNWPKPRSS